MAEVHFDLEYSLEPFVFKKKDVIVERDRCDLRKAFLHAHERTLHVPHRDGKYSFQHNFANVPVDEHESQTLAAFSGNDEVSFRVPQPFSFVDTLRSFGDHPLAVERGPRDFPPVFASEYLRTMQFDAAAVHTFDVSLDRWGRDVRDRFLNPPEPARNRIRRLIVEQQRIGIGDRHSFSNHIVS